MAQLENGDKANGETLGRMEAQIASHDRDISDIKHDITGIYKLLSEIKDRVGSEGRTNWQTFAAIGMLILAVLGIPGGIIAYHLNSQHDELKEHLENELTQAIVNRNDRIGAARELSAANDEAMRQRLSKIEEMQNAQVKADLEELRQRRMNDHK